MQRDVSYAVSVNQNLECVGAPIGECRVRDADDELSAVRQSLPKRRPEIDVNFDGRRDRLTVIRQDLNADPVPGSFTGRRVDAEYQLHRWPHDGQLRSPHGAELAQDIQLPFAAHIGRVGEYGQRKLHSRALPLVQLSVAKLTTDLTTPETRTNSLVFNMLSRNHF
jgi:hypothetical protein